jgi:carboxymethylenebutenolidase
MARRVAKHGYYCILPDMYYRLGMVRFDIPRRTDAMSVAIRAAMNHIGNAEVTDDTAGILSFMDGQAKCKEGRVGCVGYCMSGRYITTVAGRFPDRFASAASLYGVGIVTDQPDSPHLLADKIKGELYYGFAETDQSVPPHVIPTLKEALDRAKVKYTCKVFPKTAHGFCFPERAVYAPEASEQHWADLFELWDRTLKNGARKGR